MYPNGHHGRSGTVSYLQLLPTDPHDKEKQRKEGMVDRDTKRGPHEALLAIEPSFDKFLDHAMHVTRLGAEKCPIGLVELLVLVLGQLKIKSRCNRRVPFLRKNNCTFLHLC